MPAHNLTSCHHCGTVQKTDLTQCSFCHAHIHQYTEKSAQQCWLFLITGLFLYVPANMLPIMRTSQLGNDSLTTITGGVILLWEHDSYLVAAIIFIASVLVPIAKFIALTGLCLAEQFKLYENPQNKMLIYRAIEFIGRWSMVDVFVVAFLASLIQMGNLMSVYPGPAVLAFAGMVVFTMLSANSLNPKLFWKQHAE